MPSPCPATVFLLPAPKFLSACSNRTVPFLPGGWQVRKHHGAGLGGVGDQGWEQGARFQAHAMLLGFPRSFLLQVLRAGA